MKTAVRAGSPSSPSSAVTSAFGQYSGRFALCVFCRKCTIGLRSVISHRQAWLKSEHRIFLILLLVPSLLSRKAVRRLCLHARRWKSGPRFPRRVGEGLLCMRSGTSRKVVDSSGRCADCSAEQSLRKPKYVGLIFHDLRRSAARNARASGVAEGATMKMGGWKARSVFERYAIVAESDMDDAIEQVEALRVQIGHKKPEIAPNKCR